MFIQLEERYFEKVMLPFNLCEAAAGIKEVEQFTSVNLCDSP